VAHELRTPLTALAGEAALLAEQLERMPPEAKRPAQLLVEDVSRLRRLVEELMEISRLDAGREDVRTEPVDLGSLAAGLLRSRGWDRSVSLDADPVVVPTDPRRAERIVSNLIENALAHGGRDVAVRIGRDDIDAIRGGSGSGPGDGAGAGRAGLRALLQGRPGPGGRRQRARARDRARECAAARGRDRCVE